MRKREPSPRTMRIARKMVLKLEVRTESRFGDETWKMIKEHLVEIEDVYEKEIAKLINELTA